MGRPALPRLVLPGVGEPAPGRGRSPAGARFGEETRGGRDDRAGDVQGTVLAVVEEIERLLDGGHWTEADGLYVTRCDTGQVFSDLPAAGLGQRAASAFVATPDRRAACSDRPSPDDLSFYLNDAGLHAMHAGDLATAREYLSASRAGRPRHREYRPAVRRPLATWPSAWAASACPAPRWRPPPRRWTGPGAASTTIRSATRTPAWPGPRRGSAGRIPPGPSSTS